MELISLLRTQVAPRTSPPFSAFPVLRLISLQLPLSAFCCGENKELSYFVALTES